MNELEHPTGDPYGAKDGKDLISGITVFPMEPHVPRKADIDPKAAIRAERQVATMFGLSSLSIVLFVVAYIKVPADKIVFEHEKFKYAVQPDGTPNILIDDYGVNTRAWDAAGGTAIKYQADEDSLDKVVQVLAKVFEKDK